MESEHALAPGEYLLRRVFCAAPYSQVRSDGSLTRGAYTPNREDTDGLSLYREKSCGGATPRELAASGRRPASCYVIYRIRLADIQSLGLSVVPVPSGLPGHCVIQEFTFSAYNDKTQKQRWVRIQESLCALSEPAPLE